MKISRFIAMLVMAMQFTVTSNSADNFFTETYIIKKNNTVIEAKGDVDERHSPCSTFKIALSLMGFDAGILIDKNTPKWEFREEYEQKLQSWYKRSIGLQYNWIQSHTPATYMENSVVWFSQLITERLGEEKFKNYVEKLNYGNKDVSGTAPHFNDGLLNSWLQTSLKISPAEQVEFLEKMLLKTLPLSIDAQEKTAEIMQKRVNGQPEEWKGWKLYGKTGGGKSYERWFVGWVEKDGEKIVFANYIGLPQDTPENRAKAPMPKDRCQEVIERILTGGQ